MIYRLVQGFQRRLGLLSYPGLSDRSRANLLFWCLVTLFTGLSAIVVYTLVRQDITTRRALHMTFAQRAADQANGFVQRNKQILQVIARYGNTASGMDQHTLESLANSYPAIADLVLLDQNGIPLATATRDIPPHDNPSGLNRTDWLEHFDFEQSLPNAQGQEIVTQSGLVIVVPVDEDRLLAARFDLQAMRDEITPQQFGHSGRIYLVTPQQQDELSSALPHTGFDEPALIRTQVTVPTTGVSIVAQMNASEFYASARAYTITAAIILLFLVLAHKQAITRLSHVISIHERQITEQTRKWNQAEENVSRLIQYDTLTSLPNRTLFLEQIQRVLLGISRTPQKHFAVLILDCDRFKMINDSLGHTVGDQFLVNMTKRLETGLRASDTVARLGGDEFIILIENLGSVTEAVQVAERIQEIMRLPFQMGQFQFPITVSIGIVFGGIEYGSPEEVLRDADIALYRAKSLGKDRYEVFHSSLRQQVMAQIELESELRQAMENGEFVLHYQPIVSLVENRVTGFEALIRWASPARGLVGPDVFIPVAEETGLIITIGEWIINEACQQIANWQRDFPQEPPLTMNVNISGVQFFNPSFQNHIQNGLVLAGLEPSALKLEITESIFLEKSGRAATILNQLRKSGVQIEIDDFGTGYSSLAYLHHFPINTIKIDRSFINQIGSVASSSDLLRTIVNLARDLGMQAVAEGVETQAQLDLLRDLKCPYFQGFFFSQPRPSFEIEHLLRNKEI